MGLCSKNFIDDAAVVARFDIPDYSHGNVIFVHQRLSKEKASLRYDEMIFGAEGEIFKLDPQMHNNLK